MKKIKFPVESVRQNFKRDEMQNNENVFGVILWIKQSLLNSLHIL